MTPVIILGSGMAGYTLAREFRKLDSETPLIMISSEDGASYAKPGLSNAFTAGKSADALAQADALKMGETLSMTIMANTQVSSINTESKTLTLQLLDAAPGTSTSEQTLEYRDLVLAVGASPITLPIKGDAADQLLQVNSLQDYRVFRDRLDQLGADTCIGIIGAGLIGVEFANDLIKAGYAVTLMDLAEYPLPKLIGQDQGQALQSALEDDGVVFKMGVSVAEASFEGTEIKLGLSSGDSANFDLVLSAVGLKPNTELASDAGIECGLGITVDKLLKTSAKHVYAIGDCAVVEGHFLPYVMPLMSEARALAKTLSGEATSVKYGVMPIAVKTPSQPLCILPAQHAEGSHTEVIDTEDGHVIKTLSSDDELLGFVLMGKAALKERMALSKQVPDLLG